MPLIHPAVLLVRQITAEFKACTVKDSDRLRFDVGSRVQCNVTDGWLPGTVIKVLESSHTSDALCFTCP